MMQKAENSAPSEYGLSKDPKCDTNFEIQHIRNRKYKFYRSMKPITPNYLIDPGLLFLSTGLNLSNILRSTKQNNRNLYADDTEFSMKKSSNIKHQIYENRRSNEILTFKKYIG